MKKTFKLNKNGKIELSKEELKQLLDEAYWDGYRNGSNTTWTYTTPSWSPYIYTTCSNNGITINSSSTTNTAGPITTSESNIKY